MMIFPMDVFAVSFYYYQKTLGAPSFRSRGKHPSAQLPPSPKNHVFYDTIRTRHTSTEQKHNYLPTYLATYPLPSPALAGVYHWPMAGGSKPPPPTCTLAPLLVLLLPSRPPLPPPTV